MGNRYNLVLSEVQTNMEAKRTSATNKCSSTSKTST